MVCSRHNCTIQPSLKAHWVFLKWALFFCEPHVLSYTAWLEELLLNLLRLKSLLFLPHGFNCSCSSFICFWSKISSRSCHEGKTVCALQISTMYWSAVSAAPCAGLALPQFSRQLSLHLTTSILEGSEVTAWQGGPALETSCLHLYGARKAAYYSWYLF